MFLPKPCCLTLQELCVLLEITFPVSVLHMLGYAIPGPRCPDQYPNLFNLCKGLPVFHFIPQSLSLTLSSLALSKLPL